MFQAPHLVSLIRFGEDEPSTPEFDFSTISQLPAFKEAVSIAARELAAQETQGLKHKNDELLNENKKFKSISANLRQGIDDEEDLKALSAGKITYKDIRDRHLAHSSAARQKPTPKAPKLGQYPKATASP